MKDYIKARLKPYSKKDLMEINQLLREDLDSLRRQLHRQNLKLRMLGLEQHSIDDVSRWGQVMNQNLKTDDFVIEYKGV